MEKKMTQMEFDEKMKTVNLEQKKATQPLTDLLSAKVQEKARIKKQIADLHMRDKQLGAEYEETLHQRAKLNTMYEERKLELYQRFNAEFTPQTKHPVDEKMMHHVRRCVLACLKNAFADKCNPDDIEFNFHFEEDGNLKLDCIIPDIK